MKVTVTKEWTNASKIAAMRLMDFLLQNEGSTGLNLATGNSPKNFYASLKSLFDQQPEIKKSLQYFHLDEFRNVKDAQSYANEIKANVLDSWGFEEEQFHPWELDPKDLESACLTLSSHWHSIDKKVCILGIGTNGHIGFNEPGSPLHSSAKPVELTDSTKSSLKVRFDGEEVPSQGLGFGIADILAADRIILLASGPEKAKIIARALLGPISPECPASFLRLHPNCEIFLDEDAAHDYRYESSLYAEEKHAIGTESKINGNILFLSPHPDDTSISAGGLLSRHASSNEVKTINIYSGHRSNIPNSNLDSRISTRKAEAEAEAKTLNIAMDFPQLKGYEQNYDLLDEDIEYIANQITKHQPKHIFAPWIEDPHPAHKACTKLLFKALEIADLSSELQVWFYETPWGLFRPGQMNVFVALSKDETITKLKAIGMHSSQVQRSAYDYASDALSRLRSVVSLEQEFAGYGKAHGVDLGKNVECFYRISVN